MFTIQKKMDKALGRAGVLETPHGIIETPAFVTVGTKATVKALSPEDVHRLGAQVVLANTYHLYLEPGEKTIAAAGGLHRFMNWSGPTMTDSGGFQVFSLGAAFCSSVGKIRGSIARLEPAAVHGRAAISEGERAIRPLAEIDEDGVTFRSHRDGSEHRFTPERSIEIQHDIGADIIFAFDECTSAEAPYDYQKRAMERTHAWAARSLKRHYQRQTANHQLLFGIVQGGRHRDLRGESARVISSMRQAGGQLTGGNPVEFDGFGIGGSFDKDDIGTAVRWVNALLPEEKPRHLLGIGEPLDLFEAVENGCDLFDCVAPTRMARSGTLYTRHGKVNITNARFVRDFAPIEENCCCLACRNYTRAYLAHLFRSKEMFAATLASIHNLYFFVHLVADMRFAILEGSFLKYKEGFCRTYPRGA